MEEEDRKKTEKEQMVMNLRGTLQEDVTERAGNDAKTKTKIQDKAIEMNIDV